MTNYNGAEVTAVLADGSSKVETHPEGRVLAVDSNGVLGVSDSSQDVAVYAPGRWVSARLISE